jgi:multiple sugar transport system substrate-binding protein
MQIRILLVAVALVIAPFGAQAADLVVWWEKGYYSEEDEAVREIIAAFEHGTGAHVELTLVDQGELPGKIAVALEGGVRPTSSLA